MTDKTFQNSDLFFTLVNVPGLSKINYINIIKNWFEYNDNSKYRYIEDSDIIQKSYKLAEVDNAYPGISTIAVVSNPWIRMVRGWEYSKQNPQKFINMGIDISSFENSIRGFKNIDPSRYLQSRWVTYKLGNGSTKSVDYLLKEESIQDDFKSICDYFKSDRLLDVPDPQDTDYKSYFTDETKDLVYEIFKEDIDFLGYEF